jgi:hypothetical protein
MKTHLQKLNEKKIEELQRQQFEGHKWHLTIPTKKQIETNRNSQLAIIGGKEKEDTPHKGPLVKVQAQRKCNNQNVKKKYNKKNKRKERMWRPMVHLKP